MRVKPDFQRLVRDIFGHKIHLFRRYEPPTVLDNQLSKMFFGKYGVDGNILIDLNSTIYINAE